MSSGRVAKATLLLNAEKYILQHGLLDLTLTGLAAGIGSNRRMLLYHFGSLDELVRASIGGILERRDLTKQLAALLSTDEGLIARLDNAWAHLADPSQEAWHRIFFAQVGLAVEDPETHASFLERSRAGFPGLIETTLVSASVEDARSLALSISAVWSGLELALLAGEAREDLAEAHHRSVCALLGENL
ncbi:hypothetical protein AX769_03970 [Frondihabitans sp. PAMC 28766]|uniref:hypothetical protein n=1 Tax=Frondihabitans sp. PAMC 28766 TaxID=1795630 RepID=UPI00078B87F5|nr:hypothetical protein [Frondihabitans sp. PAMC 28766]AMM19454.1 hypothetical protein AX769_03970 [Frondihabitans sp. PAMC 28766]